MQPVSPKPATVPPILMVVEDDLALLKAITFAFETEGFDVRGYESGEALLQDEALPARGCLVIDFGLPGVDGLEVLSRLRARGVATPAVLITTANQSLLDRARAAGAPVVEKPLLERSLLDEVQKQLAIFSSA
jgi:FixJ family two-component response regulator